MFRIATALLLTLVATLAHAEQVVPLTIGGTEVRIAMQDGYLRASEKAPALFATSAAALPPALRLVDAVIAESDLKRMLATLTTQRTVTLATDAPATPMN